MSIILYHVLIDSMINQKNHLNKSNLSIGKIRNNLISLNGIPVCSDFNDALTKSNRICDIAMSNGSISLDNNKCVYPVFGTVILKLSISGNIKTIDNILNPSGIRDYSSLVFSDSEDVILYNVGNLKRGLINKSSVDKISIVGAYYNTKMKMDQNTGFSLLNLYSKYNDIIFLKQLFDKSNTLVDFPNLSQNKSGGGAHLHKLDNNKSSKLNELLKTKHEYLKLKKQYENLI